MKDSEEELEPDTEPFEEEEESELEEGELEEEEEEEDTEEYTPEESKEEKPSLEENDAHLVSEEATPKASSLSDIPMKIIIEVGRVQMPIKSVMNLKPGNLLDLHLHPESGVDLVVNGSRIGKGELIQIGDMLGVRILEMG